MEESALLSEMLKELKACRKLICNPTLVCCNATASQGWHSKETEW